MNLNKGISIPIALLLIVVTAAVAGVAIWYFTTPGEQLETTPQQLSDYYTTQATCESEGYYWYDDTCYEEEQSQPTTEQPGDYITQTACESADYYWYDDACHEEKHPETANWERYTNEEYGFEFKYPGTWGREDIVLSSDLGQLVIFSASKEKESEKISVSVWNTSTYSYDELRKPLAGGIDPDTIKEEDTILSGYPATKYSYISVSDVHGGIDTQKISVSKEGLVYVIVCKGEKCENIISTFEFTD
jgi:hypothetical protein